VEALLLAGGKGERLGTAAGGRPKALVPIAGRALCSYTVVALARAGVERIVVSCAAGREEEFERHLSGLGAEIVIAAEPEPLGRGGGLRFAAERLLAEPPVFALNADDVVALDYGALLARHVERGATATITVTPLRSPFGVVDIADGDVVAGFREAPQLPLWISCGVYVLGAEALERLPRRGDHETSTFPELADEGKLHAFRYDGTWLTVNTPKDLRRAEEWVAENPAWLPAVEQ
jgi:NDP-sugar pyrophosphorylase family protein